MYDILQPHGLQQTRLLCPPLSPWVCSNLCPLSWWCYLTILFSTTPFSLCLQSFSVSGSFPMSLLLTSGGQNIGVSTSESLLSMYIQGWFRLELTDLNSFPSKILLKVFSSTTICKHFHHSVLLMVQPPFMDCSLVLVKGLA